LLQCVDDANIQDPKNILDVKKYVDSGLQCLAVSFFLETPARKWSDCRVTAFRFERQFAQGKWHSGLVPRRHDDCFVFVDLYSSGDDTLRNVTPRGGVNTLSGRAWPVQVVAVQHEVEVWEQLLVA
jgi:hypothetical protein